MNSWKFFLVAGLAGFLWLSYQGLWGDPRAIPTVLIGTPAPPISGPALLTEETISPDQLQGKVVLLNFWASWCLECRQEHSNLLAIDQRFGSHPDFVMLGVNYQDRKEDALEYLKVYGNSFRHVRDLKGAISIDYGVYGVPETFVIDQQGIIRFKYVGPLFGTVLTHVTDQVLQPLLDGKPLPQA
ncbi:MAG TPA: redoxin domain-containing protein [Nitrospiria bacterium]